MLRSTSNAAEIGPQFASFLVIGMTANPIGDLTVTRRSAKRRAGQRSRRHNRSKTVRRGPTTQARSERRHANGTNRHARVAVKTTPPRCVWSAERQSRTRKAAAIPSAAQSAWPRTRSGSDDVELRTVGLKRQESRCDAWRQPSGVSLKISKSLLAGAEAGGTAADRHGSPELAVPSQGLSEPNLQQRDLLTLNGAIARCPKRPT